MTTDDDIRTHIAIVRRCRGDSNEGTPTVILADDAERLLAERDAARAENAKLRGIAAVLQWMARRYADGRTTYAPKSVNDATRYLLSIGVNLNATGDNTVWARDSMGRAYDGLTDAQATPGTPEAMGKRGVDAAAGTPLGAKGKEGINR